MTIEAVKTIIECLEKEHFCDSCPNQDSECAGYGCVYVNAVSLIRSQKAEFNRLQQENEQLRELVRLAVEDMTENYKCHICKDHEVCMKLSSPKCGLNYSNFTWRHADKLKERGVLQEEN